MVVLYNLLRGDMMGTNDFHNRMISMIRSLGLHQPNRTPCGQPVSISEAHTIMELERAGELNQSQLTQALQLEKSTVSRLVQQLEKKGWLIRKPSAADQRIKNIQLSETGRRVAERLNDSRKEKFDSILQQIPLDKRSQLIESLDLLVEAMNHIEKEKE